MPIHVDQVFALQNPDGTGSRLRHQPELRFAFPQCVVCHLVRGQIHEADQIGIPHARQVKIDFARAGVFALHPGAYGLRVPLCRMYAIYL